MHMRKAFIIIICVGLLSGGIQPAYADRYTTSLLRSPLWIDLNRTLEHNTTLVCASREGEQIRGFSALPATRSNDLSPFLSFTASGRQERDISVQSCTIFYRTIAGNCGSCTPQNNFPRRYVQYQERACCPGDSNNCTAWHTYAAFCDYC